MKPLQSERGYVLLVTLFIVVVFSILGSTMMFMTLNGANRSESREGNVQALRLATKGEEYLLASFNKELNDQVKAGVNAEQFLTILNDTIAHYSCAATGGIRSNDTTKTGEFAACISEAVPLHIKNPYNRLDPVYDEQNPYNPYQQLITIDSTGDADTKNRSQKVQSTYVVGKDLNLGFYEFAISARGDEEHAGNMHLAGQLDLNGNIYIKNQLTTSNEAQYYTKMIPSNLPKFNPISDATYAPNRTIMTNKPVGPFYGGTVPPTIPITFDYPKIDVAELVTNYAHTFDKTCSNTVTTNCTQVKTIQQVGGPLASAAYAPHLNTNEKVAINPVQSIHKEIKLLGRTCLKSAKFNLDINVLFEEATTPNIENGSCLDAHGIKKTDKNDDILISDNGIYTAGNLFIGHSDTYDDSPRKPTIQLKGNFYVEENLYLMNVKVDTLLYKGTSRNEGYTETEANFYVKGDVYIFWSEFRNNNINIYAEGDIHFLSISDSAKTQKLVGEHLVDETLAALTPPNNECIITGIKRPCHDDYATINLYNKPSILNGLVYSNGKVHLHTASSNLTFNGGVSAADVNITGVAGPVFTQNSIDQTLPIHVIIGGADRNSLVRHVTNENRGLFTVIPNSHPEKVGLLPYPFGVNYCISKNYKVMDKNPISPNTYNDCAPGVGWHYIANETYSFPTKQTQTLFTSRVKINQPNREQLLAKRIINTLNPPKAMSRELN